MNNIPWGQLSQCLSARFQKAVGTPLTQDHLQFLTSKLFRSKQMIDFSDKFVTWSQFTKNSLKDGDFSFWRWFYGAMELVALEAQQIWNHGLIMGFVSRNEAEERLKHAAPGTFLMRFSDRVVGGLTIAYKDPKSKKVLMISPYTEKDLKLRPLAKRIADLEQLTHVYPCKPKEEAFKDLSGRQTKEESKPMPGYVKSKLVTKIDGQVLTLKCPFVDTNSEVSNH